MKSMEVVYIFDWIEFEEKKSQGVRSRECAGQATGPPLEIDLSGSLLLKELVARFEVLERSHPDEKYSVLEVA